MQNRRWILIGAFVGISLVYGTAGAQDQGASAGSSETAAMMEKAQKYMTPGENHRVLDPLVGTWTAKVSSWMKPGDKAEMSEGTSKNAWALNKHHLRQSFKGSWAGKPFEGVGYLAYDNVREEYQSVWLDSMGTGIMYVAGKYDPAAKTLNFSGTMGCPMTGEKDMWYRAELKILGPNKHTYSTYSKDPDGKEFKGMEIVYTRTK